MVAQNRRLAHEMALQGAGTWEVTVAAPSRLRGDLRQIDLEPIPHEAAALVPLAMRFGGHPHLRHYRPAVRPLLRQAWDLVHCWEEPYVAATAQIARHVAPAVPLVLATFQNIAKTYPPPFNWIER